MKLIYLDTSNFSLLTETKETEPIQYDSFIQKWKQKNFILAVSMAHLDELLRLGIENSRFARFNILEDFLPFRFENRLQDKEILKAFIEKQVVEVKSDGTNVFPEVFSQVIATSNDLNLLKAFDFGIYREILEMANIANKHSWEATTQATNKKNEKIPRLSDLPATNMPAEVADSIVDMVKNIDTGFQDGFLGLSKEELNDIGNNFLSELLNDFINTAQEKSPLEAMSKFISADLDDQKTIKKPIETLLSNFSFNLIVSDFCTRILDISDFQIIEKLKSKININDCSGLWLREQVKLQLKLAKDSKPSNEKDLEHTSHLPYVDLFFSDRRIVSATNQVLRKPDLIYSLKSTTQPICISNKLEALEEALFS